MTITIDIPTAFLFFAIGFLVGALAGVGWLVSVYCRKSPKWVRHESCEIERR